MGLCLSTSSRTSPFKSTENKVQYVAGPWWNSGGVMEDGFYQGFYYFLICLLVLWICSFRSLRVRRPPHASIALVNRLPAPLPFETRHTVHPCVFLYVYYPVSWNYTSSRPLGFITSTPPFFDLFKVKSPSQRLYLYQSWLLTAEIALTRILNDLSVFI